MMTSRCSRFSIALERALGCPIAAHTVDGATGWGGGLLRDIPLSGVAYCRQVGLKKNCRPEVEPPLMSPPTRLAFQARALPGC